MVSLLPGGGYGHGAAPPCQLASQQPPGVLTPEET